MLSGKLEKLLHAPATALFLATIAPCLFVWSKNLHMYTWEELGVSLSVILLLSCLICIFIYFLCKITLSAKMQKIRDVIFCLAITGIIFFFSDLMIQSITQIYWHKILSMLITTILFASTVACVSFRPVNIFLAVFTFISVITIFSTAINDFGASQHTLKTYNYTLRRTPNIYLFILESYHDLETMRQVYNIDTADLEKFLDGNNFVVYEDALSNSDATLETLADIFTMQLGFADAKGNKDVDRMVRFMLGGSSENVLLQIFKENGYHTEYILRGAQYYTLGTKGIYLDVIDVDFSPASWLRPVSDLNRLLTPFLPSTTNIPSQVFQVNEANIHETLRLVIPGFVDAKAAAQAPLFLFFKGGAEHAPLLRSRRASDMWMASGVYKQLVKASNEELMHVVAHIIKRDPESVCILLGDHGAQRLDFLLSRYAGWKGARTWENLNARLHEHGETLDALVKDIFGIFMAVRMPGGRKDISYGFHMSPVNVFRHIFTELNEDPAILNDRALSESKTQKMTLARDGAPLLGQ